MQFSFEVKSGKVHLTDPCYDTKTVCGLYNVPAVNGTWYCSPYYNDEGRVAGFRAHAEGYEEIFPFELTPNSVFGGPMGNFDFGVDSGQFGIFDAEIYEENGDYGTPGFYNDCCDTTLTKDRCGVVRERGFVSNSGYGDGGYYAYGNLENGKLTSFWVEFICEEDEEDEDFDDDEDNYWADEDCFY